MRKAYVFTSILLLLVGFAGIARATLYDRGLGMVYDSDLNITWLQNANLAASELSVARRDAIIAAVNAQRPSWLGTHTMSASDFVFNGSTPNGRMTWWGAMAWVDQLVVGGFDDWRLPTTLSGPYQYGFDGSTTGGLNITTSEMGHLYYVELENKAYVSTTGVQPQPGWGLKNVSFESGGPGGSVVSFQNVVPFYYWSSTESVTTPGAAWTLDLGYGYQSTFGDGSQNFYAWAARSGDVSSPVPEPATILLMGTGLFSIRMLYRRRNRRRGRRGHTDYFPPLE